MKHVMDSALDQVMHRLNFIDKNVTDFEQFHKEILHIFSTINSALPGKHFDVPSREDVEALYKEWQKAADTDKKRDVFVEAMTKKLKLSKVDDFTLIVGMVTPPAAMAAKRGGESIPQLKMIKSVPDVVFVPSVTILSLISVKIFQRMIKRDQHPA